MRDQVGIESRERQRQKPAPLPEPVAAHSPQEPEHHRPQNNRHQSPAKDHPFGIARAENEQVPGKMRVGAHPDIRRQPQVIKQNRQCEQRGQRRIVYPQAGLTVFQQPPSRGEVFALIIAQ